MPPGPLLVLLGAGSSYDCVDPNTTRIVHGYRPPLVNHLFARNDSFDEILNKYSGARARADEIRTRVQHRGEPLEQVLRRMTELTTPSLRRTIWEVPLYLQELFGEISQRYVSAGSTKFETMVASIMRSPFQEVLILTVNYDLFIEQAICSLMRKVFRAPTDYVWRCDDQNWWFIKLHGSVNWGRRLMPSRTERGWNAVIPTLTDLKLADDIVILNGHTDETRYPNGTFHYPALSLPVVGKTDFVCSSTHLNYAREIARRATHILVIGFSALDDHVLQALVTQMTNIEHLRIVCGSHDAGKETCGRLTHVNAKFDFPAAPFEGGFSDFVGSGELYSFLNIE